MIHHNRTDSLSGDPIALCCWMIPCYVCMRLCLPLVLHSPLLPNTLLHSARPLQGLMTTCFWSAIGWNGYPSQHLPITLPWRRVGSTVVLAGVRHSNARRKLRVNMGVERCQRWERRGVRNCVGKSPRKRFATWMKESLTVAAEDTWGLLTSTVSMHRKIDTPLHVYMHYYAFRMRC